MGEQESKNPCKFLFKKSLQGLQSDSAAIIRMLTHTHELESSAFSVRTVLIAPLNQQSPQKEALMVYVIPPRFERGTHSLEGCCSVQLSYGTEDGYAGRAHEPGTGE